MSFAKGMTGLVGVALLILSGCGRSAAIADKAAHKLDKGVSDSWMKFKTAAPTGAPAGSRLPVAKVRSGNPTDRQVASDNAVQKLDKGAADSWMGFRVAPSKKDAAAGGR